MMYFSELAASRETGSLGLLPIRGAVQAVASWGLGTRIWDYGRAF